MMGGPDGRMVEFLLEVGEKLETSGASRGF